MVEAGNLEIHPRRYGCESILATREGRARLSVSRNKIHWWYIAPGKHVGYFKGATGGYWRARLRKKTQSYLQMRIGMADDAKPANGEDVLTFEQACGRAETWFKSQVAVAFVPYDVEATIRRWLSEIKPPEGRGYTVAHAIYDYLLWCVETKAQPRNIITTFRTWVLPYLGQTVLADLKTSEIQWWLHKISVEPARIHSKSGHFPLRQRSAPVTEEEKRARRNTANHTFALLRAALNRAYYDGHTETDNAWKRVRPLREAYNVRTHFLTADECRTLVEACEPGLKKLVSATLFTGCRLSELRRMVVEDYISVVGKVQVLRSKTRKSRVISLNDDGKAFFQALTYGRAPWEPMFLRSNGRPWMKSETYKPMMAANRRAGFSKPATFYTLRHTYASHAVMAGIPLIVLAKQMGHCDTKMLEKHYAHFAEGYIDRYIQTKMPGLGGGDVKRVRQSRGWSVDLMGSQEHRLG